MKAQHVLFTLLLLAGFLMIEPVQLKAADEGNESLDRLTTNLNAAYALKTMVLQYWEKGLTTKLF